MYMYEVIFVFVFFYKVQVDGLKPKFNVLPNYLFATKTVKMTCDIGEDIVNITMEFQRSIDLSSFSDLGSVTYYDHGCTSESSTTYKCEPGLNITELSYTPVSTPSSDEKFRCRYMDALGNYQVSNTVTVKRAYIPQYAILSPTQTSYTIRKGNSLNTIQCSANSCWPACSFSWSGPNFNKSGASLSITNIARTDDGMYFCQAKNFIGSAKSSNVTVKVQYGPENIKITPLISSYTKLLGQTFGPIICSAECFPACNYLWIFPDNSEVHSQSFLITTLQKKHDGSFTCRATNNISNQTVSFSITINYPPQNIRLSYSGTSYTINEYSRLVITCSAECKPSCSFKWYDINYGLITSNTQLIFSNVTRSQAKQYRCNARNNYGSAYSSYVNVIVYTKPSAIETITAVCTTPNSASVAWIPDLTVVPSDNFTLYYMQIKDGADEKKKILSRLNTHQEILIMFVDSLIPGTNYKFLIKAENSRGSRVSPTVFCTTSESRMEIKGSISSLMVIGIVLIAISVLLITASIIMFCLIRYRIFDLDKCHCCNCFLWCLEKLPNLSSRSRKNSDYENVTKPQVAENETYQGEDINISGHYEDLKRHSSHSSHSKPYDQICVQNNVIQDEKIPNCTAESGKDTHYINLRKAQENAKTPEIILTTNQKGKFVPEVALTPNKKAKKQPIQPLKEEKAPVVVPKPNKTKKDLLDVALKPIAEGQKPSDIKQKGFKYL